VGVMSYEETLDVSCMAVTPACSKGALGTWRSQCSARTLSRDHAALAVGTSSLVNRRGRCVCRSVLKLRRESGKTHEGKPRSEPDWGNPTVRDRRGACGIVVSMGTGLRPNGKLLDRPPDPAVTCAPHFYPDLIIHGRPPAVRGAACASAERGSLILPEQQPHPAPWADERTGSWAERSFTACADRVVWPSEDNCGALRMTRAEKVSHEGQLAGASRSAMARLASKGPQ
jgi:hypothetical protein